MYRVFGIILAAGAGSRMNADTTKQLMMIGGKTVLERSYAAFEACPDITDILVVAREDELDRVKDLLKEGQKLRGVVVGGKTRAESSVAGFLAVKDKCDIVAIHDAARCLISLGDISRVVGDAARHGAASAVISVVDSVKQVDCNGFISRSLDRDMIKLAATPQVFKTEVYKKALDSAKSFEEITDDNMLVERAGFKIYATEVSSTNIKITHQKDILLAEYLIGGKEA